MSRDRQGGEPSCSGTAHDIPVPVTQAPYKGEPCTPTTELMLMLPRLQPVPSMFTLPLVLLTKESIRKNIRKKGTAHDIPVPVTQAPYKGEPCTPTTPLHPTL